MAKRSAQVASAGIGPAAPSRRIYAPPAGATIDSPPAFRYSRGWVIAAAIALGLAAFASSLTYCWDSDIFWHLASGHWMLDHGKVLGTDPFGVDPMPQWVNVHWLFQLIISALHSIGGFEMLSVFKAVSATAILLVFFLSLRRHAPAGWLLLCGLAMLVTIAGRIRVRPESFTLLYLTVTILLVDSVRRGAPPQRLWWMAPIMLAWVNMHGIFILGLAVVWSAIASATIERLLGRSPHLRGNLLTQHALLAGVAATVACFVTPWPLEAVVQPLLLWTRVSGENAYFTYAVSEFFPTYQELGTFVGPAALAAATALAMLVNFVLGLTRRQGRVPLVHVIWLAAFVYLGALAKRNVALTGPVCGFLLAWHGKDILLSGGARLAAAKVWPVLTIVMIALAAAMTAGYATEYTFRKEATPFRFGAGLVRSDFPIDMAQWMARTNPKFDGDVFTYDFGDASSFMYYCSLGRDKSNRLVYMDGRLEAHDMARFINQHRIRLELKKAESATKVDLPKTVRFIVLKHNAGDPLIALSQSPRYRLVYVDGVAACFEDTLWSQRNGDFSPLPPDAPNLAQFDQPLTGDGQVAGTPRAVRPWWRQNPVSQDSHLGEMFLWLGQYDSSEMRGLAPPVRYRCTLMSARRLIAAAGENVTPSTVAAAMLAEAFLNRAYQNYYEPSPRTPVNMDLACSLRAYRQMDLTRLSDENVLRSAVQHIRTLMLAGQADASAAAMSEFLSNLPPVERVRPRREYYDLRDAIGQKLQQARDETTQLLIADPILRAHALTSPRVGLIDKAIQELTAAQARGADLARISLMLGDLLLRKGEVALARQAYAAAGGESLPLRLALCDWADGNYFKAQAALAELAGPGGEALASFYHADLLELIGDYAGARKALEGAKSDDPVLSGLIDRLRLRLEGL